MPPFGTFGNGRQKPGTSTFSEQTRGLTPLHQKPPVPMLEGIQSSSEIHRQNNLLEAALFSLTGGSSHPMANQRHHPLSSPSRESSGGGTLIASGSPFSASPAFSASASSSASSSSSLSASSSSPVMSRVNQTAVGLLLAELQKGHCLELQLDEEQLGLKGGQKERCDERWLYQTLMGDGFLVLFCLALVGNLLNLVICQNRSIRFFVAIRMLSIKICMNMVFMVFMMSQALRVVHFWEWGSTADVLYWLFWPFQAYFINVFGFCAIWLTVLMTAECYMHVFHPTRSRALFTPCTVWKCTVLISITGLVLASIYPLNRTVSMQRHCNDLIILIGVSQHRVMEILEQAHTILNLLLSIIFPLVLLVFMTLMLCWRLMLAPALLERHLSTKNKDKNTIKLNENTDSPVKKLSKQSTASGSAFFALMVKKGSASSQLLLNSPLATTANGFHQNQQQSTKPMVSATRRPTSLMKHFSAEKRGVTRITLITTLVQLLTEAPSVPVFVYAALHGPQIVNESEAMCALQTLSHFLGPCNASLSFFVYLVFSTRFRHCFFKQCQSIGHWFSPTQVRTPSPEPVRGGGGGNRPPQSSKVLDSYSQSTRNTSLPREGTKLLGTKELVEGVNSLPLPNKVRAQNSNASLIQTSSSLAKGRISPSKVSVLLRERIPSAASEFREKMTSPIAANNISNGGLLPIEGTLTEQGTLQKEKQEERLDRNMPSQRSAYF